MIKRNKALLILFIAVAICYGIGWAGDPFFLILLRIPVLILIAFLLITNVTWKFMSPSTRKRHEEHIVRFRLLALCCVIFFFYVGPMMNDYCLPRTFHPISLLGNAGFVLFTGFLFWGLIRSIRKSFLLMGTGLFVLFITLLGNVSASTVRPTLGPAIEALRSLPYLTWSPIREGAYQSGVIRYDQARSFQGLNIYNPRNLSTAFLLDMKGVILHAWSANIGKADTWNHIEMTGEGDLFAIVKDETLVKLNWDSDVQWVNKMRFHHDLEIHEGGNLYVLSRRDRIVFHAGFPLPILDEFITVLSPDGKVQREVSLYETLKDEIPFDTFTVLYQFGTKLNDLVKIVQRRTQQPFLFKGGSDYEIFHANTIEIIDRTIPHVCKKGDVLLSFRNLNLIVFFNMETKKAVWKWGIGELDGPHHPTLLPNGHLLVFDNGMRRGYSRVLELDPVTQKIVWEYRANPPEHFFTVSRGANQRLPNGNTLITNSDNGHVFEVTGEGGVVWEFYNPELDRDENKRATIYRMMRLYDIDRYPVLGQFK